MKHHRMSFMLLVNILLSEEDCQAPQKEPFRNSCDFFGLYYLYWWSLQKCFLTLRSSLFTLQIAIIPDTAHCTHLQISSLYIVHGTLYIEYISVYEEGNFSGLLWRAAAAHNYCLPLIPRKVMCNYPASLWSAFLVLYQWLYSTTYGW